MHYIVSLTDDTGRIARKTCSFHEVHAQEIPDVLPKSLCDSQFDGRTNVNLISIRSGVNQRANENLIIPIIKSRSVEFDSYNIQSFIRF